MMDTLIGKLLNPAIYPHPVETVELLQTHISWVVLAGQFAYKIKKPVDFGFLDFSTLERRHFFCLEELRLNRRLAPQLYLEVIAVTGSINHPAIDGSGHAIEYAVKMHRFAEPDVFVNMLAEQRIAGVHLDALAAVIAAFHARIPPAAIDSDYGKPETIQAAVLDNFTHIGSLLPSTRDKAYFADLRGWSERQYRQLKPLLRQRKRSGFVRECHGDLHLGNIVLLDGEPVPFDAIEFNARLRWIDVVSEIAFTVMDLQVRQRTALAYRLLNRYLAATGDYAGVRLLRYYLVYRAMVRAKIALLSLASASSAEQKEALNAQFERQLQYAVQESQARAPVLMLCHGVSGSGKSTLATRLAERFPAFYLRSDWERKRICGLAANADSASAVQQGIYTENLTERTYQRLAVLAKEVLQGGYTVVVDATFLKRWQRRLLMDCAAECHAPWIILALRAEESVLRQRVQQRLQEGEDASEANLAVLERQLITLEPLTPQEQEHTSIIQNDSDDVAAPVDAALTQLRARFSP